MNVTAYFRGGPWAGETKSIETDGMSDYLVPMRIEPYDPFADDPAGYQTPSTTTGRYRPTQLDPIRGLVFDWKGWERPETRSWSEPCSRCGGDCPRLGTTCRVPRDEWHVHDRLVTEVLVEEMRRLFDDKITADTWYEQVGHEGHPVIKGEVIESRTDRDRPVKGEIES